MGRDQPCPGAEDALRLWAQRRTQCRQLGCTVGPVLSTSRTTWESCRQATDRAQTARLGRYLGPAAVRPRYQRERPRSQRRTVGTERGKTSLSPHRTGVGGPWVSSRLGRLGQGPVRVEDRGRAPGTGRTRFSGLAQTLGSRAFLGLVDPFSSAVQGFRGTSSNHRSLVLSRQYPPHASPS